MSADAPIPADYAEARARFRAGVHRLGWDLEACPVDGLGPGGESLTIDVARSRPGGARRVLVVSSGLHGVEGPFGSAVQCRFMDDWRDMALPDTGVVLLHALNPWGFAWSRRVDADNVDLNRNFLTGDESYEGCAPLYVRLDSLLNPASPPGHLDLFPIHMLMALARHGSAALRQALVTGQYAFPRGLFFGGVDRTATVRILDASFDRWIEGAEVVLQLDLHTGLGLFGTYKLLVDPDLPPDDHDRLVRWFGASVVEPDDPRGTSYRARGTLGEWCRRRAAPVPYLYGCAEFGTYGSLTMLAGLRAENRASLWGRPDDVARARDRLRDLFCPPSRAWRTRVLADALELIHRGLDGLGRSS